jgi:hypothetical protein
MSTATLTRSQLDQLQPGDVITTIDGHQLPRQLTVERALDAVNDTGTRGIRVANPLRTATEWVIYPGQVHEAITVERPEPKPKRRATRTVGGVTFTHHEDGAWRTDDGRFEIGTDRFLTLCYDPHPVFISKEDRHYLRTLTFRDVVGEPTEFAWHAVRDGRRGYHCEGNAEHYYTGWVAWDAVRDEHADDEVGYQTFRDAALGVVARIRREQQR